MSFKQATDGPMKRCFCVLLGVLLVGTLAARPFSPGNVSAKAKWFVHADLQAFKKSSLGKFVLGQADRLGKQIQSVEEMLKLDIRRDLHGVTLYGVGKEETEAVVVLHGRFDRERITALASTAKEHRVVRLREHKIHSWEDKKGTHYGCLLKDNTLVFSDGMQTLRETVNVLEQKSLGLETKAIVRRATAGDHPFFLLGLVDFKALGTLDANAKILQKLNSLCFAVGQAGGDLQGRLLVQPHDKESGGQIMQIFKGMVSFAQIEPGENDPEQRKLKELVKRLKIEMAEPFISINLKIPVRDIVEAMKLKMKTNPAKATADRD
tara:strand:- start:1246 stop:2211 length:966 start_codon:yes stop_codon:yes gene_type:complete